ncbi:putative conserved membrane protein [Synechococcus sp. MVIR-18-1]|nr:putative conserved membrane protein [Synechococcus sp. MVIR-18-1]
MKPERSSCHPDGPGQHLPMFQTNDPRFWKAVAGIISLVLSCSLAWLILKL